MDEAEYQPLDPQPGTHAAIRDQGGLQQSSEDELFRDGDRGEEDRRNERPQSAREEGSEADARSGCLSSESCGVVTYSLP